MLNDQTIVCFAPEPWRGLWRNRHQLMTLFARTNRVLWVEPRPYISDTLHTLRTRRLHGYGLQVPRARPVRAGLFAYQDPLWLPLSGRRPLAGLTAWARMRFLRRTIHRVGNGQLPLLWLFRPDQGDVIGHCGEQLVIYHAVDDYAAYEMAYQAAEAANRPQQVRAMEEKIVRAADLVLVTSAPLLAGKARVNSNTHLVPNGVNYAAFATALADPAIPDALALLPRPLIGFAGAVNEKVDLRLLAGLAAAHPEWSLVLVGPITLRYDLNDLTGLRGHPNVHLLGPVPVEQLPHYIKAYDVCLMPYKVNTWTENINPLKLYEYLAAGRPIVSTAIPAAVEVAGLLGIAESPHAFARQVAAALSGAADEARAAARRAFAAGQTWEARAGAISDLIEEALRTKRHANLATTARH